MKKNRQKPYVVLTKAGNYYFSNKRRAYAFAKANSGFFDKTENYLAQEKRRERLKGVI